MTAEVRGRAEASAGDGARIRFAVREAVGGLASPDVRDLVLAAALHRAGLAELPVESGALGAFVRDHLGPEADAQLGGGSAAILTATLDEVVQRTSLAAASPARAAPDLGDLPTEPTTSSPPLDPPATTPPPPLDPPATPRPVGAPRAAGPEDGAGPSFALDAFPDDLPLPDLADLPAPPPPERAGRRDGDAFGPGPRDPWGAVLYALHVATRLQRLERERRRLLSALPLARRRASIFLVHLARTLVARDTDLERLRGPVADVLDEARQVEGRVASRGLAVLLTVAETVDAAVPGGTHEAGDAGVEAPVALRRLARSVTHLGGQALRLGWGDVAQASTSTAVALRRSADLDEELARNRLVVDSYDEGAYRLGLRLLAGGAAATVALIVAFALWS